MREKLRTNLLFILDIFLITLSVIFSYLLRFDGSIGSIPKHFLINIPKLILMCLVIKLVCFYFFKLYSSLWKYASIYEMISIVAASFISNSIVLSCIFISRITVPRSIFLIAFFVDVFLVGGVRFAYRIVRRIVKGEAIRFKDSKRVLIIGAGDAGAIIIRELNRHHELKSIPVAIIDDNKSKIGKKINGVPILGNRDDIVRIVEKKSIDEIIIAIPSAKNRDVSEIVSECSKTGCKVKILPSVSQLIDESVVIQKVRDVDIEDLLGRDPITLDSSEVNSFVKNQTILVTGGGGSIGSELCRQIATYSPKRLIILDFYENNAYDIQNELIAKYPDLNLEVIIASIRDQKRLEEVFKVYRPNIVFHAAAHKHVPLMEANPSEAIKNNVFGTLNVAECASRYATKRFVLISSDKAVNPTNIMGATKRIAEMIIQALNKHSKTEFVAVRFGNVLGSNGSVIPLFKKQIEQGGPVTVTHPDIIRYFMTIPEAVQLVLQAGAMAKGGEIFVLDMGEPVKIYDLAKNLIRLSGFEPDEDIKIEFTGLRPGEKLYEELLMAEEGLQATQNNKIFVAQPVFTDFALLNREIDQLRRIINDNMGDIKDYISVMVPTYRQVQ